VTFLSSGNQLTRTPWQDKLGPTQQCHLIDALIDIRAAQQHIYSSFLKRGIKIYEMWDKKLHAKMASIDGIYSYVGSFNLDAWSSRNLEVNVTVLDPPLAHQLEDRVRPLPLSLVAVRYLCTSSTTAC
jgi:hypothetical protein